MLRLHLISALSLLIAPLAAAQEDTPIELAPPAAPDMRSQGSVEPSNGTYNHVIPIKVPSLRGITPKLALAYNSMAQNGQVGVGWRLVGFSKIVAVGPNKGAVQPDKPVTYLLDGEELLPCSAQTFVDDLGYHMSPSCQSARVAFGNEDGFYSTETESSVRIRRTATGWTVARTDGSVATYQELVAGRVWGLRYVDDTKHTDGGNSNRVTYNWLPCAGHECYPNSIQYTRAEIRLYWSHPQNRLDPLSFGDGDGLWTTTSRLKTIQVLVGSPATESA